LRIPRMRYWFFIAPTDCRCIHVSSSQMYWSLISSSSHSFLIDKLKCCWAQSIRPDESRKRVNKVCCICLSCCSKKSSSSSRICSQIVQKFKNVQSHSRISWVISCRQDIVIWICLNWTPCLWLTLKRIGVRLRSWNWISEQTVTNHVSAVMNATNVSVCGVAGALDSNMGPRRIKHGSSDWSRGVC